MMNFTKLAMFFGSLVFIFALAACGDPGNREGQAQVPLSARDFQGENYQDVINDLENAGFTNIHIQILDDLITGWLTRDGSVNQVSINGDTGFRSGAWFPTYAEIIVIYHTFPIRDVDTGDSHNDENDEPIVETAAESMDEENDNEPETIQDMELEILTIENNAALADLFSPYIHSMRDIVLEFAEMHMGRTIEFDGFIADSLSTRPSYRDVRFWFGDYEDVDFSVLLTMDSVYVQDFPAVLRVFQNVRVIAEIVGYDVWQGQGVIQLYPISIRFR